MGRRCWVDESGLGAGWTRIWTTGADTIVDLSHAAQNGCGFGNTTDELKRFQTFTIPKPASDVAYDLNGLQLKVRKAFGSDQSDLIAELYETENNLLTGLSRTTVVIPSSRIKADWTIVNLSVYFAVDWFGHGLGVGRKYAVVLSQR